MYKYVCVKAGACGNHSCLVRDSLRNAADPGQRSKRSSVKHFSGERLVHVLLYTNKINEIIVI